MKRHNLQQNKNNYMFQNQKAQDIIIADNNQSKRNQYSISSSLFDTPQVPVNNNQTNNQDYKEQADLKQSVTQVIAKPSVANPLSIPENVMSMNAYDQTHPILQNGERQMQQKPKSVRSANDNMKMQPGVNTDQQFNNIINQANLQTKLQVERDMLSQPGNQNIKPINIQQSINEIPNLEPMRNVFAKDMKLSYDLSLQENQGKNDPRLSQLKKMPLVPIIGVARTTAQVAPTPGLQVSNPKQNRNPGNINVNRIQGDLQFDQNFQKTSFYVQELFNPILKQINIITAATNTYNHKLNGYTHAPKHKMVQPFVNSIPQVTHTQPNSLVQSNTVTTPFNYQLPAQNRVLNTAYNHFPVPQVQNLGVSNVPGELNMAFMQNSYTQSHLVNNENMWSQI